ncbi:MAG: hypothetical protein M1839_001058 [Geoglossum umbratile]|nr:MAG: hypothetical protein M1839_001058 [Geoglossum umbratile]
MNPLGESYGSFAKMQLNHSTSPTSQFEMHRTRVVDIRKCPDMPPKGSEEYTFRPYDLIPPVGEQYLMHLFQNPEDYDDEVITYDRIPQKRDRVWTLVVGWFGLGSLVFAVVWVVKKGDVQGAFGAAAWVLTLAMLSRKFTATGEGPYVGWRRRIWAVDLVKLSPVDGEFSRGSKTM